MPDLSPRAARLALVAMGAVFVNLALACDAAPGQVVARLPVDRPAVVAVERLGDGGIRVSLEFRPPGPAPTPPDPPPDGGDGSPPPSPMAEAVELALLSASPSARRPIVLSMLAHVGRAIEGVDRFRDAGDLRNWLSASVIEVMGPDGHRNGSAIDAVAAAILEADESMPLGERLQALADVLGGHR